MANQVMKTYLPEDNYIIPPADPNESADEFEARLLAAHHHGVLKQKRKYTGEDYIWHPKAVVELIRPLQSCTTEMLCIAWLHDCVEDTHLSLNEIGSVFHCLSIMEGVQMLTNIPPQRGLNRAQRKKLDCERLSYASPSIMTVKLADLIDNAHSIMKFDPEFAKNYLTEKRALLAVLSDGDATLWHRADQICREAGY